MQGRKETPVTVKALIVAASGLLYYHWLIALCAALHYNDFGKFYNGITSWRAGESLYALSPASFNPALPMPFTNLNPPHGMLLVLPFGALPIDISFAAWMVVNGAALVAAVTIVISETGWRPSYWQLCGLGLGAPTATWMVTGQLSGMLALPLVLAWRHWRNGRAFAGGCWFGGVLAVKPFLGLFVLWLAWRRDWRALRGVALGGAAVTAAGLLVFGPHAYVDWLEAAGAVSWTWGAMNASIHGMLTRAFTVTPYHAPIVVAPWLVLPAWVLAGVGVVAAVWRRIRQASVDEAWSELMLASLLMSPLGWIYYSWWLLPGLPRLLARTGSALLMVPIFVVAWTLFSNPNGVVSLTLGSVYGWALLRAFWRPRTS
jgi:hypothetical protein